MDFNPNFNKEEIIDVNRESTELTSQQENSLIPKNEKDSLSLTNLTKVASTHIKDLEECRKDLKEQKEVLREFLHLMSAKEAIDYYKATVREMEIHAKSIRDIYTIAMRTELAKQLLLSGSKEERTMRNITPRVSKLLGLLQETTNRDMI